MEERGLFDGPPPPTCPNCRAVGYEQGHPGCPGVTQKLPTPGRAYRDSDPPTAREGFVRMTSDRRASLQEQILALVRAADDAGAPRTTQEVVGLIGEPEGSVRPRFAELARAGLIRRAGAKFNAETGRSNITWRRA
jgi:hypothetical protein